MPTGCNRWAFQPSVFVLKSNNPGELKMRINNAKKGVFDENAEDEEDDED